MHVVLPELDGRVLAGVVAFKSPSEASDGSCLRRRWPTGRSRIGSNAVADRIAALVRLQATPRAKRRIAVLLPDYPGAPGRTGYAVGLDVPASVNALLADLAEAGYAVSGAPETSKALLDGVGTAATMAMPVESLCADCLRNFPRASREDRRRLGRARRRSRCPGRRVPLSRAKFGNVIVALPPDRGRRGEPSRRLSRSVAAAAPCACWRSGCGSATAPRSTPSSTWARTARWNGCRARRWR